MSALRPSGLAHLWFPVPDQVPVRPQHLPPPPQPPSLTCPKETDTCHKSLQVSNAVFPHHSNLQDCSSQVLTFWSLFINLFKISFMFVYLDNWSLIPVTVIWIVNLTLFSIQARTETRKVQHLQHSPSVSLSIFFFLQIHPSASTRDQMLRPEHQQCALACSRHTESMSVFLNSITAIFFPSCHLHLSSKFEENPKLLEMKIENIRSWQLKFYQIQVLITNTIFMIILSVIFFLVTVTKNFNYNSNILDTFWFNYLVFLTFILGIIR